MPRGGRPPSTSAPRGTEAKLEKTEDRIEANARKVDRRGAELELEAVLAVSSGNSKQHLLEDLGEERLIGIGFDVDAFTSGRRSAARPTPLRSRRVRGSRRAAPGIRPPVYADLAHALGDQQRTERRDARWLQKNRVSRHQGRDRVAEVVEPRIIPGADHADPVGGRSG
jgi:hypothetical protein